MRWRHSRLCKGGSWSAAAQLDGIVQQVAIAAAHHVQAGGDEAPGPVLPRVALPIGFVAAKDEQRFGDAAIAFAGETRIERPQGERVKLSKLIRHGTKRG